MKKTVTLTGQSIRVMSVVFAFLAWGDTTELKAQCFDGVGGCTGNIILGTPDDDVLKGDNNPNRICGLLGNDTVRGNGGDDCLNGNGGNDRVYGNLGNDSRVRGGQGDDIVRGGGGERPRLRRCGRRPCIRRQAHGLRLRRGRQ